LLHTFRAARFEDAIAQLKRSLGPEALVVARRKLDESELRDGGKGGVEVTAISGRDAGDVAQDKAIGSASFLQRRLIREGVPESAARALADAVRERQTEPVHGMATLQTLLAEVLGEEIVFGGPIRGGARVVALVGPTGVGKTTTIAKLAAREQLGHGKTVGLVTIDQYRIGGVEQLGRYADLIGCEMEVASDIRSLDLALDRLAGADLVLVDTAGRSTRDDAAMQAMAQCLRGVQEPVDVHLCLAVAMRERELSSAIEHYGMLDPVRLTFTKVDEALCSGTVIAGHVLSGLPLAYLTTGQRVPEDITLASPSALAMLLCDGEIN
jgi:flagellar biosynthesis protein FlhF